VEVDPRSIEAWHALANFDLRTADLAGAERALNRALD
jgi:cytochrome c-type biogenesis protein CcmH/NrfG